MNNAYMVADTTVNMSTAEHHVRLDFNPIMTTFDITVRAGRYEVATGIINPVTVTGVSVIMPKKIDSDKFIYNVEQGTVTGASAGFQSVYVGVRNGTSRYVDLHEGETLNLMAFLPPVDMNANAGENNKMRIMVHTTGMDYVMSVDGDQITKQNKYFIQLPDMSPYDSAYNDWISELDSTTLLTQMSIPAYVCTGEETADEITALLKKGVRAMSIDLFFEKGDRVTTGVHTISLRDDVIDISVPLNNFLENSDDFLIVWYNDASSATFKLESSRYFDEKFSGKWQGEIGEPESGDINVPVSDLKGKLIVLKKNTRRGNQFIMEERSYPVDSWGYDRYDLFPYKENVTLTDINMKMSSDDWGAQFVTDNSINKKLYEYISSYDEQTGCTGIVTIPNAKDIYVDGQYKYSDLLIQSIIDCNFKFRH